MREYPKTENLFVRDPDTHKLVVGELRDPIHGQIGRWFVTEKVDGTNIRLLFQMSEDGNGVTCEMRGRSDNAQLPPGLEDSVVELTENSSDAIYTWMGEVTGGDSNILVCVYGEGYGAGIQKVGGAYRPKEKGKSIRIFDVATTRLEDDGTPINTWWRSWEDVEFAAAATGLATVPVLDSAGSIDELVDVVRHGFRSETSIQDGGEGILSEGVVARTDPYLYDHRQHRVMFKLKTKDIA